MPDGFVDALDRTLTALVVDDSTSTRLMLGKMLQRWDFRVLSAVDGREALSICRDQQVDILISDWMMPGMSGPELCRAIRALMQPHFTFIVLMTSKSATAEIAEGLDAGADDFLIKPTSAIELRARLSAGQRLIRMHDDLRDKNARISEAYDRLHEIHERIDRDLQAAARLQAGLIPAPASRCGPFELGLHYRPLGHVGGDLIGFYPISDTRIGVYSIDVSGHGISSALMTAQLAGLFDPVRKDENIGLVRTSSGTYRPRDPSAIASDLNVRLGRDSDHDLYLTMVLADLNADTGMVRFCQAGHPHPMILRSDGSVEVVGDGGMPIGLIDGAQYETYVVHLSAGERFATFSDGMIEAVSPDGEMLDENGLLRLFADAAEDTAGEDTALEVLQTVVAGADAFVGENGFEDDLSIIAVTMPERSAP